MFLGRRKPPAENTGPNPWEQFETSQNQFAKAAADIEKSFGEQEHTLSHALRNVVKFLPEYTKQQNIAPSNSNHAMAADHALQDALSRAQRNVAEMRRLRDKMNEAADKISAVDPHAANVARFHQIAPMKKRIETAEQELNNVLAPIRERHPELFPAPRT